MTNGIKIPVDLSGLNQAMDAFQQKAKQVTQALSGKATIDTTTAKQNVADLQKAADALHKAIGDIGAAKVPAGDLDKLSKALADASNNAKLLEKSINAVGGKGTGAGIKQSLADSQKLARELREAQRIQQALAKQGSQLSLFQASEANKDFQHFLRTGGASAKKFKKFGDLGTLANNWRDIAGNEVSSRRGYREMMSQLGLNGGPADPNPAQPRTFRQFAANSAKQAGIGVIRTAIGGAGVGGQISAEAFEAARSTPGGAMSARGMGTLLGGLGIGATAYGAIKAVGAVRNKVRGAEEESISYADLSRRMGDASVSFESLRQSVRSAASEIDVTFGEGSKLAESYVKAAGVDGLSGTKLHGELASGGLFARGMGLDPEAGTGLFATLRHNKASGGDSDNKRFAMMIGEAIAHAGVFTKADEVLAAVQNYTQTATRAQFGVANVGGFVGGMDSMMSTRLAGLDPQAAASMLGKVDAGIRNPTSPAARNFMLGMLQRNAPGVNAADLGSALDGGAFGTLKGAFGLNSAAMHAAMNNGDEGLQVHYDKLSSGKGADKTMIDMVMGGMAGKGTDFMRENLKGMFNMSSSEANAAISAYRVNGNSMSKARDSLSQFGIDPSKFNAASIPRLLGVAYGDHASLSDRANSLLRDDSLDGTQKLSLSNALKSPGKDDLDLKKALIGIESKRGVDLNEGDITRKNMVTLDNISSNIATKLIPLTNAIREGVTALASMLPGGKFRDTYGNSEKARGELMGRLNGLAPENKDGRANLLKQEYDRVAGNPNYSDEYREFLKKQLAESPIDGTATASANGEKHDATAPISNSKAEFLKKSRRAAEIAAAKINAASGGSIKPEWLQAQWGMETGWGQRVIDGTNNLGNIKARNGGKEANVLEYNPDGTVRRENARFRSYGSPEEFGGDYANLMLKNRRYRNVVDAGSASDFAAALQGSGYGTDPKYGKKVFDSISGITGGAGTYDELPARESWKQAIDHLKGDDVRPGMTIAPNDLPTMGVPLPGGDKTAQSAGSPQASINVRGEFHLIDPSTGMPRANPLQLAGVGVPMAAGQRGMA
jgi:flagellum-specific peptidoglycan hydrolase FlgJ